MSFGGRLGFWRLGFRIFRLRFPLGRIPRLILRPIPLRSPNFGMSESKATLRIIRKVALINKLECS